VPAVRPQTLSTPAAQTSTEAFTPPSIWVPGLRDTVASGHREQRFVGTADLPNQYRTSVGPGWALLGDAGHHKDPSTGMGIADAVLSADLLAEAIHSTRILGGSVPIRDVYSVPNIAPVLTQAHP